jgi:hypothetical protein
MGASSHRGDAPNRLPRFDSPRVAVQDVVDHNVPRPPTAAIRSVNATEPVGLSAAVFRPGWLISRDFKGSAGLGLHATGLPGAHPDLSAHVTGSTADSGPRADVRPDAGSAGT